MAEGRIRNDAGTLKPEYFISDQQGNVRSSFEDNGSGTAVVRQQTDYYAFGMQMAGAYNDPLMSKIPQGGTIYGHIHIHVYKSPMNESFSDKDKQNIANGDLSHYYVVTPSGRILYDNKSGWLMGEPLDLRNLLYYIPIY